MTHRAIQSFANIAESTIGDDTSAYLGLERGTGTPHIRAGATEQFHGCGDCNMPSASSLEDWTNGVADIPAFAAHEVGGSVDMIVAALGG